MEKLLHILVYISWALWLAYSYVILFRRKQKPDRKLLLVTIIALPVLIILLKSRMMMACIIIALFIILVGMFRKPTLQQERSAGSAGVEPPSLLQTLFGLGLPTLVILSLFFLLGMDFKSDSNYFIEKYQYNIEPGKKEIIIGNSKEDSDITIENNSSAKAHLRLILNEVEFSVQNTSNRRKVDLNGRYLNKLILKEGDEIEINGREKIKVLRIQRQYPLGRSLQVSIKRSGQEKAETLTLHTLLNKPFIIQYRRTGTNRISIGLNKLLIPASTDKSVAVLSYEPSRHFLGLNIYYIIVLLAILLLSIGIYLYLRNRFNGALLLLLMASLPFMAGMVSPFLQLLIVFAFVPFIFYIQIKKKPGWNWGAVLLVILFAGIFLLPHMLRMVGDFTFRYYDFSKKDSLLVTRGQERFQLKDIKKPLAYDKIHRLILGHTAYKLYVTKDKLSLTPLDPEKIKISNHFKAIICDLNQVRPGNNYVYLKFPHQFEPIPAKAASGKERLTITDDKGNNIVLSRLVNENYGFYLRGLVFYLVIPFWLFMIINHFGFSIGRKQFFRLRLFTQSNLIIYNLVFFLLGLGYVILGALALYNNSYLKNFEKYRGQALPLFLGVFFLALILSRYNRWPVFLYRVLKQKKFHVPLITGFILILLVNYSKIFLYLGILFFIFVFFIRLRKDIYLEYKNSQSYPLNIKNVIEKRIAGFGDRAIQQIFFGLGKVLDKKGWNYLIVADLLLLLALFFIVLQIFLGGELGVSVAGFFFLPIELGKILLTIYFADWVSRIDKGMELNVLWIYGLVLLPFVLLVVFLKDFSPLVIFSFVFLYHIIKINKPLKFKLLVLVLVGAALVLSVTSLGQYTFPFKLFSIIISVLLVVMLLRVWFKRLPTESTGARNIKKILVTPVLVFLLAAVNYVAFFRTPSVPASLAGRVNAWLNPWQDFNLSYQHINSLWLMKGTGTFGKGIDALTAAPHVPLIEKDLSFSLYVSVLGTLGTAFIFFTLFMIAAYVHRLARIYGDGSRGSPSRWTIYLLEFLTVIFLAQFIVPALYAMGLLPIMGQPLPFLSYSNNLLLLFALPFSFLMIVLGNNLEE